MIKKPPPSSAPDLREAGFAVDHCLDGEDGLHRAVVEPYDAAVVDIMLPKLDGLSLIERLRQRKVTTPVLVLSAKGSVDDRVKGLQVGGDDYLPKPFAFSELLARLQAPTPSRRRPPRTHPPHRRRPLPRPAQPKSLPRQH